MSDIFFPGSRIVGTKNGRDVQTGRIVVTNNQVGRADTRCLQTLAAQREPVNRTDTKITGERDIDNKAPVSPQKVKQSICCDVFISFQTKSNFSFLFLTS